jgi:hypothetical protein
MAVRWIVVCVPPKPPRICSLLAARSLAGKNTPPPLGKSLPLQAISHAPCKPTSSTYHICTACGITYTIEEIKAAMGYPMDMCSIGLGDKNQRGTSR